VPVRNRKLSSRSIGSHSKKSRNRTERHIFDEMGALDGYLFIPQPLWKLIDLYVVTVTACLVQRGTHISQTRTTRKKS
jgi:hypothetical protein